METSQSMSVWSAHTHLFRAVACAGHVFAVETFKSANRALRPSSCAALWFKNQQEKFSHVRTAKTAGSEYARATPTSAGITYPSCPVVTKRERTVPETMAELPDLDYSLPAR